MIPASLNPIWDELLEFPCKLHEGNLTLALELYDKDTITADDFLGITKISLQKCVEMPNLWQSHEAVNLDTKEPGEIAGKLTFSLAFVVKGHENALKPLQKRQSSTNELQKPASPKQAPPAVVEDDVPKETAVEQKHEQEPDDTVTGTLRIEVHENVARRCLNSC